MAKRIQDLKTPTTRVREQIVRVIVRPFEKLTENQRFWLGFVLLCLLTTLLINNPLWHASREPQYREGDVAHESIVSPADIYFTDTEEAERLRNETKAAIKPIFRYKSGKAEKAVQRFLSSWETLQRHGKDDGPRPSNSDTKTETHWVGAGGADVGKILSSRNFSRNEIEAVESALREGAEGYVYDDRDKQYFQGQVTVFDRS